MDERTYKDVLVTSRQARVQKIRREEEACRNAGDGYAWMIAQLDAVLPDTRLQQRILAETRELLAGAEARARAAQADRHKRARDILLAIDANTAVTSTTTEASRSVVTYRG